MILPVHARIPGRGGYDEPARIERLEWARARSGRALQGWRSTGLAPERLSGNVENLVGTVEIPVGLAGPLAFRGERARGAVVAPFATSEGALVASASRGAAALSRAGGVRTRVLARQMTRVPLFALADAAQAARFVAWLAAHEAGVRAAAESATRHGRLLALEPIALGRLVHVRFRYDTGEAAGQNMVTACTWAAVRWIAARLPEAGIRLEAFWIDANLSGDKKVCRHDAGGLRGARVVAEAVLSRETCVEVLHAEPAKLIEVYNYMREAAELAGMVGFSVNAANAIAAIFAATGQDLACIHESGVARLRLEAAGGGLRATLLLPGLVAGTVGGGTALPGARAGLELLGCDGEGGAERLAEIVAGFALGLELSTLAAIVAGEFADAHERLGRNRPVEEGRVAAAQPEGEAPRFDPALFEPGLRGALGDPDLRVTAVEPIDCDTGSSILSALAGRGANGPVGLFPLALRWVDGGGPARVTEVVLKVKARDEAVLGMIDGLAAAADPALGELHRRWRRRTGFVGCDVRELAIYEMAEPRLARVAPRCYGVVRGGGAALRAVILERLSGLRHMNSVEDVSGWTRADLEAALDGIAGVHAAWLGREAELRAAPWMGPVRPAGEFAGMAEWWEALSAHAARAFPDLVGPAELARRRRWIADAGNWWTRLESMPRTLVHHDFNPRNVAFRDGPGGLRLCAWDWELATLHVPQRDLAELLAFVLPPDVGPEAVPYMVERHRRALERESGRALDAATWREGYGLALRDLALDRIGMYLMAHTTQGYPFLPRVVATLHRLVEIEEGATR